MIPGTLNWALGLLTYRGRAGKPAMLAPVVHKLRELRDALEANPPLEAPVLAEGHGWEDEISGVGPCWIVSAEYEPLGSCPVTIRKRELEAVG